MNVLVVSGYKPFELGIFNKDHPSVYYLKAAIKKSLAARAEEGLEWVLISGQLGVELWAAEAVFELQPAFPELKLAVITPFLNQDAVWNEQNKEWYESVLVRADFTDSVSKRDYEKPWQFRLKNQFFIEKSDGLLMVYDEEKEGSPKYLLEMARKYANSHPYEIELIDFYDLQMIVEEEQLRQSGF